MSARTVCNITAFLPTIAAKNPYQLAVLFPHGRDRAGNVSHTHYTFQQLNEESDRLAYGLQSIGISQGVRTVLMVKPSLNFFSLTFALLKVGAVPILVDPGMGIKNLGQCLAEAQPQAFIGIPKAHLARKLFGWGKKTIHLRVTTGPSLLGSEHTLKDLRQGSHPSKPFSIVHCDPNELAAILFTSGSTGPPKGAVYTHSIFLAQLEMLRDTFAMQPGEIDLCTFPLFALFGPALSMTAVIPDMNAIQPALVDPRKIIEAITDFGVTNLFGSPALLNRVGLYGEKHNVVLPSLRRVVSAGAPVSPTIIERFTKLLAPGVQVFTPYGATEVLPVTSIGSDEILGETRALTAKGKGVCVGKPARGIEVAILKISDDPIPQWSDDWLAPSGEIGEIAVKGRVVTPSYFNRPEATALAKITDPRGGFWHRMGDLGYFDSHGRLWMCGRKSQRVILNDKTLFTVCCEGVFNAHPAVYRTALVGAKISGQIKPVLCVELKPECRNLDEETIRRELLELGARHSHTSGIKTILFHPGFPVDIRHNSKIFREKLALWAARKRV